MELLGELQQELVVAGLSYWDQQAVAYSALGQIVQRQAYVYGFQDSFMLLCILFLATMVPLSLLRRRHMRTPR